MKQQTIITHSAEETRMFGKRLAREIIPGTLLCLTGDLGAGKTTFVQGLLEGLGAKKPYVSPTFIIMKQYDLPSPSATGVRRVYHADAYRVEAKDFQALGLTEWREDMKGIVILEWPERVQESLPTKRTILSFRSLSDTEREIKIIEE